ncbi:hypothetical protein Leryth_016928 [Lithospermum erythrorhizon]|nr:hypothetical protein Leryth_016928 [Lithospermum erythrorhizon]
MKMDTIEVCTLRSKCHMTKLITSLFFLFLILIFLNIKSSPSLDLYSLSSKSWGLMGRWQRTSKSRNMVSMLQESVTFLPLKDLRFSENPTSGNTWFMSSLNDTHEENEAEHLYFPSDASKGRVLCIKGRDTRDGTKNSYALAWPEALPDLATLLKGLTFVSDTYYNHENLWHGVCATIPFVRWSMKNNCIRPDRWVLFHWGELRLKMGSWIEQLMRVNFGEVYVEGFNNGSDIPYCFEKVVIMRHDLGRLGLENKLKVSDHLRCKARKYCEINPIGRGVEVNERGEPIIRFTLLLRRGSRSFKNSTSVTEIFAKECAKIQGCILNVVQSEDLNFCDQVRVMTQTDIVASPHGAQLTNMLFMDRNSSIMEFFPKGWLEHAGAGQYAHHWMAKQSGMKHQGAWWDPIGDKCPSPKHDAECFSFYKNGKVGHNETLFAEWSRKVIEEVRQGKIEQMSKITLNPTKDCGCLHS